jgi:hypothetical protein
MVVDTCILRHQSEHRKAQDETTYIPLSLFPKGFLIVNSSVQLTIEFHSH